MKSSRVPALAVILLPALLASCVTIGYVDHKTSETGLPFHPVVGIGAEANAQSDLPNGSLEARLALPWGFELSGYGGLANGGGDLKYRLPLPEGPFGAAVAVGAGVNFDHRVFYLEAPVYLDWRFSDMFLLSLSLLDQFYVNPYRVGGGVSPPSSHTTVRTVRYTAVHKAIRIFRYISAKLSSPCFFQYSSPSALFS
jgi:hypothetical protein